MISKMLKIIVEMSPAQENFQADSEAFFQLKICWKLRIIFRRERSASCSIFQIKTINSKVYNLNY